MAHLTDEIRSSIEALPTKSAKIRALDAHGMPRADIARFLDIRYQHVRNVLEDGQGKRGEAEAPRVETPRGERGAAQPAQLSIDADGRIIIPPDQLAALEVGPEGRVTARVVDGELHLITPRVALRKIRHRARALAPEGLSVVDEFIAEKRREAERE